MANVLSYYLNDESKIFMWSKTYDRKIIIGLAIISALIWYFAEPIFFTTDSFAYLDSAKAISGIENSLYAYHRAPLLPLLLTVTKVATSQTFIWFILTQLLIGFLCILLLHSCLRRISMRLGFFAMLLCISTFIAFVHSTSVMTEEIYLLGWCLCIEGTLAYISNSTSIRLIQITIALLILTMTRAQGAFISLIVLPFLIFISPKQIIKIMASGVILSLSILLYSQYCASHAHLMETGSHERINASTSQFGITNSTGKMLIYNVYSNPHISMNWALVHPENGPATKRLFSELLKYYSIPKNLAAYATDPRFGDFVNNPEGLIEAIEKKPDPQYWWAMVNILDKQMGAGESNKLLMYVTLETIIKHPVQVGFIYMKNLLRAFTTTTSSYVWRLPVRFGPQDIGPHLAKEVKKSGNCTKANLLAKFLNFYFPLIQFFLLIFTIFVSKKIWHSKWRSSLIFCLLLLFYNHLSVALAAEPESRYIMYAFPILLVLSTIGFKLINESKN